MLVRFRRPPVVLSRDSGHWHGVLPATGPVPDLTSTMSAGLTGSWASSTSIGTEGLGDSNRQEAVCGAVEPAKTVLVGFIGLQPVLSSFEIWLGKLLGYPGHQTDRFGTVGLCDDDGARDRSAGGLATSCIPAVRHHGGDHDCVLVDSLCTGGAAREDGLGCLPEHAAAFDGATLGGRTGPGDRRRYRCHDQEQGSS